MALIANDSMVDRALTGFERALKSLMTIWKQLPHVAWQQMKNREYE
jgi:hypothetical protein